MKKNGKRVYEEEWKDDKRNGKGKYTWANTKLYVLHIISNYFKLL